MNSSVFSIEDILHSEILDEFDSFDKAIAKLKEISELPWDNVIVRPPCTSWLKCERNYVINEWDDSKILKKLLKSTPILKVSAKGAKWQLSI